MHLPHKVANRVAEERGALLGHEVGYTIRFDDCSDPNATRIKVLPLLQNGTAPPKCRHYGDASDLQCFVYYAAGSDSVLEHVFDMVLFLGVLSSGQQVQFQRELMVLISQDTFKEADIPVPASDFACSLQDRNGLLLLALITFIGKCHLCYLQQSENPET